MSKLIIGFLLGVTVTVTAFYMLNNKSDELQERPADQFAVNESSGNEEEGILGKIPEESGDANEGAKDKLIVSTPAQLDSYAEQSDLRTESNRTLQADSTVTSPTPMPAERAPQSDYPPLKLQT